MRKFFNGPFIILNFIFYVLTTALIFVLALMPSDISSRQSDGVGGAISNIVEFFTKGKVVLINDGKTRDYPDEIEVFASVDKVMVGQSFRLNTTCYPQKNYSGLTFKYSSSNNDILQVNENGVVKVVGVGTCVVSVLEPNANLTASKQITVTTDVYKPTLSITEISSESDGKRYYSTSNNVGTVYSVTYTTSESLSDVKLSVSSGAFSVFKGVNSAILLTKKTGTFPITLSLEYENINTLLTGEKQVLSTTENITVSEKYMMAPAENFFEFESQNLQVFKGKTATAKVKLLNYNYTLASQLKLFTSLNKSIASVEKLDKESSSIIIKGNSVGKTQLLVIFSNGKQIKQALLNVEVITPVPATIALNSTLNYVEKGKTLKLTAVLDGESASASDFIWKVSNDKVASIEGGVLKGNKNGTVVVSAISKEFNGVIISKQFVVRRPYLYTIRKVLGHFCLFLLLAFFASVVYYKLAEVTTSSKAVFAPLYTLGAGLTTATISELLQTALFTIGRGASVLDALIDFSGFALGFLVCLAIYLTRLKLKKKHTF